jgi:phage baseplate assembly protein W
MGKIAKSPDYSDLDLDFILHPTTKDVVRKFGPDAIKRSVRNLILTNFYDKPFRSGVGSNATRLLFENMTPLTNNFLKNAIIEVIRNYEPRVEVFSVEVEFDYDNNGYNATLNYIILNDNTQISTSVFLERIR